MRCCVKFSYLVDEKLQLDDGRSALMLTVTLHTGATEPERFPVKECVTQPISKTTRVCVFCVCVGSPVCYSAVTRRLSSCTYGSLEQVSPAFERSFAPRDTCFKGHDICYLVTCQEGTWKKSTMAFHPELHLTHIQIFRNILIIQHLIMSPWIGAS